MSNTKRKYAASFLINYVKINLRKKETAGKCEMKYW